MATPRVWPPTMTSEFGRAKAAGAKKRPFPTSVRMSPELVAWVEKAAYRAGMTVSAFGHGFIAVPSHGMLLEKNHGVIKVPGLGQNRLPVGIVNAGAARAAGGVIAKIPH